MKKFITILALLAVSIPAFAQFRGNAPYKADLLTGPMVIPTLGVTNVSVFAYIGKDGFAVTPYFVGTNSGTANLAILAIPAPSGVTNNVAPTALGVVAMAGTTPVRLSTYTAGTNTQSIDAADVTWATSTITARYAIIYKSTGTASTSPLIAYVDFGADVISSAGNFTITWDAAGLLTLTTA